MHGMCVCLTLSVTVLAGKRYSREICASPFGCQTIESVVLKILEFPSNLTW